ncbi:MAG: type I glutamate--ammonia ligase [Deferribacteres bacterium]|nr:type I glutamate--ammonia ligase [candidate division KSB1 bacterium]MCB9501022.1 type I glutamate--ammonia ligase [Deferribacteres bacterium]
MTPLHFEIKNYTEGTEIEFIDLKVTDLNGRLHHLTLPFSEKTMAMLLNDGIGFDGSSYGFQKVENSDMIMKPDVKTALIDPFRNAPTLSFMTRVFNTDAHNTPYQFDLRNMAEETEKLLGDHGIAAASQWGPELEFYIFHDAQYRSDAKHSFFSIESDEEFLANGYHIANPFDVHDDFRDEATKILEKSGIEVKYHHHEVGNLGQQEIELYFNRLLPTADNIVLGKYILHNLAREKGLFLTFMPKPVYKQAGSGLHLHHYLVDNANANSFFQQGSYANLNETALFYIGGILKHAAALCAFTNPSTNSYKRLVPGVEAPTAINFGQANRASCVRIPRYIKDPQKTRFEYRPPDATANPYIAMSALMLAGIDGVVNKIDPRKEGFGPYEADAFDPNIEIKYLPFSITQSLQSLESDHSFLLRGNIFSEQLVQHWIKIKSDEFNQVSNWPSPIEYSMYFDL